MPIPKLDRSERQKDPFDVFSPHDRSFDTIGTFDDADRDTFDTASQPYNRPHDHRHDRERGADRNRDREADPR
jgi:hypothetical protein